MIETPDGTEFSEIRVGVVGGAGEIAEIMQRIEQILCPDPEHAPPCPVPWQISIGPADPADYPQLLEQAQIERR